jgi:hypothetical protein
MRCLLALPILFCGCVAQSPPGGAQTQLKSTEVFRDGDLLVGLSKVGPSGVVANTTVLVLTVENRSPGKIFYLPLWDEPQQAARITDEYGNTFRPAGRRYYRNPKGKNSPPANGNRVDPGADDVLVIEFEPIPRSSRRLKVELPYNGSVLVFNDVPHSP